MIHRLIEFELSLSSFGLLSHYSYTEAQPELDAFPSKINLLPMLPRDNFSLSSDHMSTASHDVGVRHRGLTVH